MLFGAEPGTMLFGAGWQPGMQRGEREIRRERERQRGRIPIYLCTVMAKYRVALQTIVVGNVI